MLVILLRIKTDIAQNKQDISNINTKINKGLNFAGDTGTVSNRQLGDTVTLKAVLQAHC